MENNLVVPGSNSSSESWFSQGKNIAKLIVGAPIVAGLVYLIATYVVPFLITFVTDLITLSVVTVVAGIILYVLSDKKFWARLGYLYEAILELTLGWIVDFDPFVIFRHQIEEKEKDREILKAEGDKVEAKKLEMKGGVDENKLNAEKSQARILLLKERLSNPKLSEDDKEEAQLKIQLELNNFQRFQDYITTVSPYLQDLSKIAGFAKKAYKYSGIAIEDAKQELKMRQDTFSAVNSGERAMKSAMRAFAGNSQTNKDAEFALAKLREKVSQKVANIHSCIDITTQYMNAIELNNAVEARQIMAKIDGFNVETAFASDTDSKVALSSSNGQFLGDLKVVAENKYMDLIEK